MDNNKIKKITICALILCILFMSFAYANLYQELRINGNASVVASWKVEITGIREGNKTGEAMSASNPTYTTSTATFDAQLNDSGDSIEYIVTVKNNGKIDAKLNSIVSTENGNDAIIYTMEGVSENDILKSGEEAEITIKVSLDPSVDVNETLNSSLTIVFNYVQNV